MAMTEWTQLAEGDLERIYEWIAEREGRRITAKLVVRRLRDHCDEYASIFASGSTIGTARPDLGAGARTLTHQRWVIVFRPIDAGIEVLRVVDGSRDFDRMFHE